MSKALRDVVSIPPQVTKTYSPSFTPFSPEDRMYTDFLAFLEKSKNPDNAYNQTVEKYRLNKKSDRNSEKLKRLLEGHRDVAKAQLLGHNVDEPDEARRALNPPKEKRSKREPVAGGGLPSDVGHSFFDRLASDRTPVLVTESSNADRQEPSTARADDSTGTISSTASEQAGRARVHRAEVTLSEPQEGLITLTPDDPSNKMTGFTSEFKGIKTGAIYKVKQIVKSVGFGRDRVDVINFTGRLKTIRPDGDQLPIFDFDLVLDLHDSKTIRLSGGKIEIVEEKILTAGQIEDKNRQLPPKLSSAVESRRWSRPARRERERITPDRALAHEVYSGRTHSSLSGFGKVINEGTDQEIIEITEADLRNLRQSKVCDRFYERARSGAKIVVNHQGDYENLKYLCLEGNPLMICFEGRGQTLRFEVQHNLDTVSVYPNVKPLRVGETIEIECTPWDETNQYNLARLACSLGTRDLFKFEDGDRTIENAEISSLREVFNYDAENLTSARGCPIFGIFTPDEVIRGVQHHSLDTSTIGRVSVTCVKSENSVSSSTPGKKITLRRGENPESKLKKGAFYKCTQGIYSFSGNKLVDWFEEKDRGSDFYHLQFEADNQTGPSKTFFAIPITDELTLEEIPEPKPAQQDPVQQANPPVNVGDVIDLGNIHQKDKLKGLPKGTEFAFVSMWSYKGVCRFVGVELDEGRDYRFRFTEPPDQFPNSLDLPDSSFKIKIISLPESQTPKQAAGDDDIAGARGITKTGHVTALLPKLRIVLNEKESPEGKLFKDKWYKAYDKIDTDQTAGGARYDSFTRDGSGYYTLNFDSSGDGRYPFTIPIRHPNTLYSFEEVSPNPIQEDYQ